VVEFQYSDSYGIEDLIKIVRLLRGPGGCPWDAVQTHESLRRNLLEESYEAVEAIDQGDFEHLKEELGDVLLQVVFHVSLEEDRGLTLDQVADGVCRKLIYRHPHVFGDVAVSGTEEVLDNWEQLKRREKGQSTDADALEAVARSLPALWRCEKVQSKAEKAGTVISQPAARLEEDARRLRQAADAGEDIQQIVGEMLFDAVATARRAGVDGEDALNAATDRFIAQVRAGTAKQGEDT